MKLLHCQHCGDIQRLYDEVRVCRCGRSTGHYYASHKARVNEHALVLGINSRAFINARRRILNGARHPQVIDRSLLHPRRDYQNIERQRALPEWVDMATGEQPLQPAARPQVLTVYSRAEVNLCPARPTRRSIWQRLLCWLGGAR